MRIVLFLRKKSLGENSIEELAYSLTQNIPNLSLKVLPANSRSIIGMFKNIIYAIKHQGDVNHVFSTGDNYIVPFIKNKTIITFHDIGTILSSHSLVIRFFRKIINLLLPLKFADVITCISNFTYSELLKLYPNIANKTVVIHNPYNPQFKYFPKSFNNSYPIILHIGTSSRKNLDRVIEAIKNIQCKLWIVGVLNPQQKRSLIENKIDFINEYDVSLNRIVELYGKCDIVSFPSLYEGFGMPIIEANAVGRVVLTSRVSSIPEIAKDAALYVNPYDIENIRKGFNRLITDTKLRKQLIENGQKNIKRFDIANIVSEYYKLYIN